MALVIVQLVGVAVFCLGVLVLGIQLRRFPSPGAAKAMSVVSHVLFHAGLSVPMVWGLFWPGVGRFDALLGLHSLTAPAAWRVLGIPLLVIGGYFVAFSNIALMKWGQGMASFVLSKHIVSVGLYQRVRNPLALGWYLMCLGIAFCAHSTYLTLYLVLGHIPAHVFYLKFFEERELTIRFGESYERYKRRVPFLIPLGRRTQ